MLSNVKAYINEKVSDLNKLQHIQQQFVISQSTFETFDSKLADCKISVCTVEKL